MANTEPKFKAEIQQAGLTATNAYQQMMYVAGETQDPSNETIALVEDIIRNQVILMLTTANELANRRGSRVFSNNDLIFQFRHDAVRVARIQTFLRWKSVRKTVKDDDDKGANPELVADEEAAEDALNPSAVDTSSKKIKQPAALLPWDIRCMYPEDAPGAGAGDDEDEEVFRDADDAALERLRRADQKTENMTTEEYATWSEYRHASFTYRKVKRFREWAGLGVIAEYKPVDDSLDILGFVTCEMVQRLTEIALSIQQRELAPRFVGEGGAATPNEGSSVSLFTLPQTAKPAVGTRHIRQAFHATQMGARRSHARLNKMARGGGRLELI